MKQCFVILLVTLFLCLPVFAFQNESGAGVSNPSNGKRYAFVGYRFNTGESIFYDKQEHRLIFMTLPMKEVPIHKVISKEACEILDDAFGKN